MNFNQLLFDTTDARGDLVKIECQYCAHEVSGYENHIKQLVERRPIRTPIGVKRVSALERMGWIFENTELVDGSISGLCPACSIADSEG